MPFKFGSIEGVAKGDTFPSRKSLGESGVHAPIQAGIWGREKEGACSIVLSIFKVRSLFKIDIDAAYIPLILLINKIYIKKKI